MIHAQRKKNKQRLVIERERGPLRATVPATRLVPQPPRGSSHSQTGRMGAEGDEENKIQGRGCCGEACRHLMTQRCLGSMGQESLKIDSGVQSTFSSEHQVRSIRKPEPVISSMENQGLASTRSDELSI